MAKVTVLKRSALAKFVGAFCTQELVGEQCRIVFLQESNDAHGRKPSARSPGCCVMEILERENGMG